MTIAFVRSAQPFSRQVDLDLVLNLDARPTASASVTVEQYEAAVVALKGPQEVRCARSTSAVTVRVSPDFESKGPDLQIAGAREQCLDGFLEILVRNQDDQVHRVDELVHPMTPVANSASMSIDPCQSLSTGWSLP